MRLKAFFKFFLAALGLQLLLLLIVCPLAGAFLPKGRMLAEFLLLYVYDPFIRMVIESGGYWGESSMIWPPVFGTAIGLFFYAALVGILAALITRKKLARPGNQRGTKPNHESEGPSR